MGEEDFAELPQDLIQKFRERFWVPEAFVSMFGQMAVIQMDDGTKPGIRYAIRKNTLSVRKDREGLV